MSDDDLVSLCHALLLGQNALEELALMGRRVEARDLELVKRVHDIVQAEQLRRE